MDQKPYSLETEERGEYLYALVSGPRVTPEIALDYWQEIIEECESKKIAKILLDHNFAEMLEMAEMLKIIKPVGELLKGRMLAFFDRFGHYDTPEAGKAILRSMNVKMQIFHDIGKAEKWLLAN